MTAVDRIRTALEPIVDDLGVELYDLELNGGSLKITLDQAGGISLDTLAEATRQFSGELDLLDPIDSRYTLEVSSPGLERVLRLPAHWRKAIGERVRIKVRSEIDGERRLEGTIAAASDDAVTLDVDGRDEPLVIAYSNVDKGRTAFDWGPTPKQGGKQGPKAPKPGSNGGKQGGKTATRVDAMNESEIS